MGKRTGTITHMSRYSMPACFNCVLIEFESVLEAAKVMPAGRQAPRGLSWSECFMVCVVLCVGESRLRSPRFYEDYALHLKSSL